MERFQVTVHQTVEFAALDRDEAARIAARVAAGRVLSPERDAVVVSIDHELAPGPAGDERAFA